MAVRREAAADEHTLGQAAFARLQAVFAAQREGGPLAPAQLTREWGREEFLLLVDDQGQPFRPPAALTTALKELSAANPEAASWLRIATQGGPGILAARWLCHLAGLRHSTVEIFIDPPHLEGHTLVQVRGMDKFESPGAFDIPCAGHVDGLDSHTESLVKELGEELNLSLHDLDDLRLLAHYNSDAPMQDCGSLNYEHRVLYRARLKPEAAGRIRFNDGEVAALAVFSLPELHALSKRYPERVASGLGDALGFYR
jgi:8-oxo-dGTP pyrophosphatase MutT (NUDIX family)